MSWYDEIGTIYGKTFRDITADDVANLLDYINQIETGLERADEEGLLGPKGWKHFCSVCIARFYD